MTRCNSPLSLETLLAYQQRELPSQQRAAVEEHYFSCAHCAGHLEALYRLQDGVIQVVRGGLTTASVSAQFVAEAAASGLALRQYHLQPGEQVACTVAPADAFVAIFMSVDIESSDSVDVKVEWTALETNRVEGHSIPDVAFDQSSRSIILLFSGDQVREFPKSQWRMEAIVHQGSEARNFGPYTLNHTPWDQLDDAR